MDALVGDKVRLRSGAFNGERGTIESIRHGKLLVQVQGSQALLALGPEDVTNFSLAARKAWRTEPNRAVGRRKGTRLCDRVSVTLRIDRDLWERFIALEEASVIDDRTRIINSWLREKLAALALNPGENSCPGT